MVKIFSADTMLGLENAINSWMAQNVVIVRNISYAIDDNLYSALVWYEPLEAI